MRLGPTGGYWEGGGATVFQMPLPCAPLPPFSPALHRASRERPTTRAPCGRRCCCPLRLMSDSVAAHVCAPSVPFRTLSGPSLSQLCARCSLSVASVPPSHALCCVLFMLSKGSVRGLFCSTSFASVLLFSTFVVMVKEGFCSVCVLGKTNCFAKLLGCNQTSLFFPGCQTPKVGGPPLPP